jgi:hypothetical protein
MTTTAPATIDIATLAEALETTPRMTRKFLRSITPKESQPGKGSRWAIEKKAIASLKKQFATFTAPADDAE